MKDSATLEVVRRGSLREKSLHVLAALRSDTKMLLVHSLELFTGGDQNAALISSFKERCDGCGDAPMVCPDEPASALALFFILFGTRGRKLRHCCGGLGALL